MSSCQQCNNGADITVLIDRSGSMSTIREDTIGGFNAFLKDQKKDGEKDRFTLVQFDHEYEVIKKNIPLMEMTDLTQETFVPRGRTALLDALGRTINDTSARVDKLSKSEKPDKVIFVIVTDGLENDSREFTDRKQIMKMIEHRTKNHDWQFIYLGANQDAISVGRSLGISRDSSMSYAPTAGGAKRSWAATSRSLASRKRGGSTKDYKFSNQERNDSMQS